MKKIILGAAALTMCILLTACGTSSSDAAITSLANQLDETSNKVSNVQIVNPSDININASATSTLADTSDLSSSAQNTQQTLLNEQYYKMEILNEAVKLKNCLDHNIKLSKAQTNAVKDLTDSLARYTNSVAYSQGEMENIVNSISSMKKNVEKNSTKISAKLNRLACNSNARSAYYENILSTLDELENCLNCTGQDNSSLQEDENQTEQTDEIENKISTQQNLQSTSTSTQKKSRNRAKNIDTYSSNDTTDNTTDNTTDDDNEEIDDINQNYPRHHHRANDKKKNFENSINDNNIYNRYNRYNASRNIDTYGPTAKNIDTFGGYGYNGYGYNGYGVNNGGYFPNNNYGFMPNNAYGAYPMNNGFGAGYGNNFANNGPYSYNSNNFNQINNPLNSQNSTFANADNVQEHDKSKDLPDAPRLENFEKVGSDNTVEKEQNFEGERKVVHNTDDDIYEAQPVKKHIFENSENKIKEVSIENDKNFPKTLTYDNDKHHENYNKTEDFDKKDEKIVEETKIDDKENSQVLQSNTGKICIVDARKQENKIDNDHIYYVAQ